MFESLTTGQKLAAALILAALVGIVSWSMFRGAEDAATPANGGDVTYTMADAAAVALTGPVVGEVRQPGLYTLPAGSRVCNAVECAGGFTSAARPDSVNLAAYLEDGQQVRVEAVPQPEPQPVPAPAPVAAAPIAAAPIAPQSTSQPAPPMASPAQPPAPVARPTSQPSFAQTQPQARVRLNSAGLEELQRIEGIGPELAKNILAYRAMNGPFRSIEALDEVPGIGPATVERIRVSASLN
jgi:competence protein ComEA